MDDYTRISDFKDINNYGIYKQLLDMNPEAIVVHIDGKLIYMNIAALQLIGANENFDYSNLHIKDVITPDSLQSSFDRLERIKNENIALKGALNIKSFDGSIKTIEVHSQPIVLNNISAILVIIRDITDIIKTQKAADYSNTLYRNVFDYSPNSILISKFEDGKIIEANTALEELSGFTKEELIGKTTKELGFWINYEDRANVIKAILENGSLNNVELKYKIKNGKIITTNSTYRLLNIDGEKFLFVIITDITNFVETQKKLIESEVLFKTIFDLSPHSITISQIEDGKIIATNEATIRLNGFQKDEMIGRTVHELDFWINKNDRDKLIEKIRNKEHINFYETQFKIRNNQIITVLATFRNININNQEFLLSVIQDITKEKKLDDEKNKLLKILTDSQKIAKIGTWAYDIPNDLLEWSDEMYNIFKKDKYNFIVNATSYLDLFEEEDKVEILKLYKKSIETKTTIQYTYKINFEDGTFKWVEGIGEHFYDDNGNHIYSYGTTQDVTTSKLAEQKIKENDEKFRMLAENTSDVLLIINNRGEIEYLSPSHNIRFGMLENHTLPTNIEQTYSLAQPDHLERIQNIFYDSIENHLKHFQYTYQVNINHNINLWLEDYVSVLYDENNNFKKAFIVSRDITKQKNIDDELKMAKDRAEESDTLKTAFLQNMSHEIRTPLNGILGFTKLLENEDLRQEEIKEFINLIKQSSYRLLDTMNNILELSQIETKQVTIDYQNVMLNSLLMDIYEEYYGKATIKNITLDYKFALDDENSIIQSDPKRLYQIVTNLLSNAIKFTLNGRVEIGYYIDSFDIVIYVKDTGIGISADHIEKIFERFYQSERSIARNYEGNGLGLAICKELTKLLGGSIKVDSELGKGSTFYFSMPVS